MPFEQSTNVPERQKQLEKLQSLSTKEKLVLFKIAFRIRVTTREEITTNFLSQLHPDHLTELYQKWHELDMKASEQGMNIASLSKEEIDALLQEVLGEQQ